MLTLNTELQKLLNIKNTNRIFCMKVTYFNAIYSKLVYFRSLFKITTKLIETIS